MTTDILLNSEARAKMKIGVDKLADAVKVTLGPMGRNVSIRNERTGKPFVTKDGVTVARTINLLDKVEDMGAQLVKMAAEKTAIQAGDGTTTSVLLSQVIINEGMKAVDEGANPVDLKKGIDKAVAHVAKRLEAMRQPVTPERLEDIATISANNDREIGKLVADVLNKVGVDGVVYIQDGKTAETTIEVTDGIQIDKGYISHYFVNNVSKMQVDFKDGLILIYERKISTFKDIEMALTIAKKNGKALLIIAEDVDGEALAVMIKNKLEGGMPIAAIKLPGFGNMQQQMLEDIAVMVGARVVSPDQGHVLANIDPSFLGSAKNIVVNALSTKIIGGGGKKEKIAERVEQVKALIDGMTSEFEVDKLKKQRLAKLTNGVGIITVGAATEVEMREKKDRIDDALCATIAASEEGVVPGGGVAYLRCTIDVNLLKGDNESEQRGIATVLFALEAPIRQILINAGITPDGVIGQLVFNRTSDDDYGYNPKKNSYENMLSAGIIDPAKVSRCAIQNAASVAAMFLTTEAAISDIVPVK